MNSSMDDKSSKSNSQYELLCKVLPEILLTAAEVCSLPHTLDDNLGFKILHDYAGLNGAAHAIWAEVKSLPFVYPYDEEEWRFDDAARGYFICRLEKRNGTFKKLNQYLESYYIKKLQDVKMENAARGRELDWRIAYHLAPVDPEAAIERLRLFGERAAQNNYTSDMKGVVDLFEEQDRWLSPFKVERAYFEGRYEYVKNNYKVAGERFRFVWENGKANEIKAIAGHLLGHIVEASSARDRLIEAESLYRESLRIGRELENKRHVAMVLNSLGGVLVKLGGQMRLVEAESLYRESLEIEKGHGNRRGVAMVSFRLSSIYEDLGDFQKACECLETTIDIENALGNKRFLKQNIQRLENLRDRLKSENES